jgi:hypothetical protein
LMMMMMILWNHYLMKQHHQTSECTSSHQCIDLQTLFNTIPKVQFLGCMKPILILLIGGLFDSWKLLLQKKFMQQLLLMMMRMILRSINHIPFHGVPILLRQFCLQTHHVHQIPQYMLKTQ